MGQAFSTSFQQRHTYPGIQKSSRSTGLTQYTGQWTRQEVVHLLKRTMFGAVKADIDHFLGMSMSAAVDELLTTSAAPSPPINNYNSASFTDPYVPAGQPWITGGFDATANAKRRASFKAWWTGLILNQPRTIEEKMTLFWHNHFATETTSIGDARFAYKNNALLRANCLGNFKDLVKQVTVDPGMLKYLNGYANTKNAPDENYARELQELFTVGKDPVQQYTQDDVEAAAKVLTGYRIDSVNLTYTFDPTKHDTTNKQFSSFYNNTIITGQSGANGQSELDDLLNMIFATNEVAEFICKKIYRFFVYYNIDTDIDTNVIQPLATIFRDNNYDIKPVLSALFKSEHFYDMLTRGCVIKTPADFFAGACREFGAVFPTSTDYVSQYYFWGLLELQLAGCTMDLGDPPNVAGWPAYYQVPSYHELWINSDTLPKRTQFMDLMISYGVTHQGTTVKFDVLAFTESLTNPADPNALIAEVLGIFFSVDTSSTLSDYLKSILLSGQSTDNYWTSAWNDYITVPTNVTYKSIVQTRLTQMYKYILDLAEYQLS